MTQATARRDHRHRPRHARRQRRRDDVGRAVAGQSGARADHAVRRQRLSDAHRRRGEGLRRRGADRATRKLLKFANRSHRFALAAAEQAMRDAGIGPTDGDGDALGLRGRRRHDGRRTSTISPPCSAFRAATASSMPTGCSTDPARQRSAGRSAAARRPPASRCSRAASASAATRRRCTPRARRAARRSARR